MDNDTICAIATAPGKGGVGIVRLSGDGAFDIAKHMLGGIEPKIRHAYYGHFYDHQGQVIDQGICLRFENPHSFTGEDVVEFQGHGGPVILDLLIEQAMHFGARMARPGEFSERAFLNDKIDLAQAEAIADLINATSKQAARQALNSLRGEFSRVINHLSEAVIHLRMYVESAIDFPEEEIDFLSDGIVESKTRTIITELKSVLKLAEQGSVMQEGMKVVIAGRPNAGKSSLLNALSEDDVAIVTDIAGTTRDVIKQHIHIDGMPLYIIDTAGLRESPDVVEQIGIERAWQEIEQADRVLLMIDSTDPSQQHYQSHWSQFFENPAIQQKLTVLINKVDQCESPINLDDENTVLAISAKTGHGLEALKQHLKACMGIQSTEGGFSARRRHIHALQHAQECVEHGLQQLLIHNAGELMAEDLRQAHDALSSITGEFTADDLLGKIFSSFCIGK